MFKNKRKKSKKATYFYYFAKGRKENNVFKNVIFFSKLSFKITIKEEWRTLAQGRFSVEGVGRTHQTVHQNFLQLSMPSLCSPPIPYHPKWCEQRTCPGKLDNGKGASLSKSKKRRVRVSPIGYVLVKTLAFIPMLL